MVLAPYVGDGIVVLANLQVAAGVDGGPFIEYPYDPPVDPRAARLHAGPADPTGSPMGSSGVPDRPGLGIELLDEMAIRRWAA